MKQNRIPTRVHTRELDRAVAHRNMEEDGVKRVNHHDYFGLAWQRQIIPSYFAKHWREYV